MLNRESRVGDYFSNCFFPCNSEKNTKVTIPNCPRIEAQSPPEIPYLGIRKKPELVLIKKAMKIITATFLSFLSLNMPYSLSEK